MSELSKFINLVIEYGQKLQSTLNKKYKPFIRSICNLELLAKQVNPQNIFLTHQLIIFKLGLQAKSTKAIEVSLFYLQKFFVHKFVDLNLPNYCEQFEIQETTVRKKENIVPKGDIRGQILKLLQPLVHFKSNEINTLLLRVYEFLITEPIAHVLIQLNLMTPNTEIGQKILFNYFSYRFFIFEEIYTFKESEFRSINPLSIRNQKINQEIEQAFVNHQNLLDLVHKYVGQMVVSVAGIGGKYGLCVICKQPADYYCKITRASLCSSDCKKRHLELAEKQYKTYYQATHLWVQIQESFEILLQTLSRKQSRTILTVLVALLEKSHLFMIVKQKFRQLIGKYVTGIVNMCLNYKEEGVFEVIYNLIAILCRHWMVEALSSIQYFFKESALKLIEDKRPNFKLLITLFKSLAKILEYGKTTIELYINFDCEHNKTNILERILFQLSKICQDKFGSTLYYNKHEKIALKNGAVTLIGIMAKGLNQYRVMYSQKVEIDNEILELKQRKIDLEKFVHKFNQHWSEGLKVLFNLNLVGLQSQQEIVQLILTTKGLKKQNIEQMLLNQNGRIYLDILFNKIIESGPFMGLVELFRVVPLKKSSVLLKHYSDFVLAKMIKAKQDENDEKQQYSITKWVGFLTTSYTLKQLEKWLYMQTILINGPIEHVYMKCRQTKSQMTLGTHKTYFRHCISQSYLKVFSAQLSLLQIPILFLLETSYSHQKVFQIINELIQICPHANWISLCLKNVDLQKIKTGKYTSEDHSLIVSCLKMCKQNAQFINEWNSILQFVSKLYKIINSMNEAHKKLVVVTNAVLLQQPIRIKQELSILEIQEYLLMIGQNCKKNFDNFVKCMIHLSEQQLQKENVFFLQKTFEILQHNLLKFISNFQTINTEFQALLVKIMKHNLSETGNTMKKSQHLKQKVIVSYSSETLIYISDMLKQLFVKILKNLLTVQQPNHQSSKQQLIELSFFKLFKLILKCQNKEANDFVMNSISMIIMVNFNFKPQTWTYIVHDLLKEYCKNYRQQVLTILQKVLNQKLLNCQHLEFQLLNLAIDLVDEHEVKLSIQSIHLLKDFVDLMVQQLTIKYQIVQEEVSVNIKLSIEQNQLQKEMSLSEKKTEKQQKQAQTQKVGSEEKASVLKTQQPDKVNSQQLQQKQSQIINLQQVDEEQNSSQSWQLISTSPKKIKQYLLLIISNLIEFISYECHEGAIQILFILLKIKLPSFLKVSENKTYSLSKDQMLFSSQEIDLIISKIFKKLESLPKELLARGEKIMNESLFWSVRNKFYPIVKNLQKCIIDKYTSISYTAMKCIKTFISMTNPKQPHQWNPIEQTLINILKDTHLTQILYRQSKHRSYNDLEKVIFDSNESQVEKLIGQGTKSNVSLSELSNKLIIQRMIVEVLPNDLKVVELLLKIYEQTVRFNDDVCLRCLLWKQGLAGGNSSTLPDILALQELISYRIISTYYWSKSYQKIAAFTLSIITRYCQASQKWQHLQSQSQKIEVSASDKLYELYTLFKDYWQKRRQPLKVIINYMLPKLPKICKDYEQKEKLLSGIIEGMKFAQERAPFVDTIRQMTLVR